MILNNNKITVLKSGSIYFFYRPKLKNNEEVQRFFVVLSSQAKKYYVLVIGKKQLPIETKDKHFLFVEAVKNSKTELLATLKEEKHRVGKGETTDPTAHCLAEGKFIVAKHENHTHFIYQITKPLKLKEIQQEFNLQKEDDYLISVKNPHTETPAGVGLSEKQKANYPQNLQEKFASYRFIPLDPVDFLNYPGTELLLINKSKKGLTEREEQLKKCLIEIKTIDLVEEFAKITTPEAISPLKEN